MGGSLGDGESTADGAMKSPSSVIDVWGTCFSDSPDLTPALFWEWCNFLRLPSTRARRGECEQHRVLEQLSIQYSVAPRSSTP